MSFVFTYCYHAAADLLLICASFPLLLLVSSFQMQLIA